MCRQSCMEVSSIGQTSRQSKLLESYVTTPLSLATMQRQQGDKDANIIRSVDDRVNTCPTLEERTYHVIGTLSKRDLPPLPIYTLTHIVKREGDKQTEHIHIYIFEEGSGGRKPILDILTFLPPHLHTTNLKELQAVGKKMCKPSHKEVALLKRNSHQDFTVIDL